MRESEVSSSNRGTTSCSRVRQPAEQSFPQCFQLYNNIWSVTSPEHQKREKASVYMFIETAVSTCLCKSVAFKCFCKAPEPKFKTPGSVRVNGLTGAKMNSAVQKFKHTHIRLRTFIYNIYLFIYIYICEIIEICVESKT